MIYIYMDIDLYAPVHGHTMTHVERHKVVHAACLPLQIPFILPFMLKRFPRARLKALGRGAAKRSSGWLASAR